jgi:hypothetical protein
MLQTFAARSFEHLKEPLERLQTHFTTQAFELPPAVA